MTTKQKASSCGKNTSAKLKVLQQASLIICPEAD